VGSIQAPPSRSPPCRSLLWEEKAASPWPRHLFARRTVHWRWIRNWLGRGGRVPGRLLRSDVLADPWSPFLAPRWRATQCRIWPLCHECDLEWTQDRTNSMEFMWCGEWPLWPLSRRANYWAKW
jgi:hypothetical protein